MFSFFREILSSRELIYQLTSRNLRARYQQSMLGWSWAILLPAAIARLDRWMAILAQRLDVDEEMDRLQGHIEEVRRVLTRDEPVGRRLDFLMQELNREANTLCSKSQNKALTAIGLELKAVIDQLIAHKALLARGRLTHSYPHSWRSKAPVIFRNTPQWFAAIDKPVGDGQDQFGKTIRERALTEIDNVTWTPQSGRNRLHAMMEARPDWVLSRQRAWGVPLTCFTKKNAKPTDPDFLLRDAAVNQRIVEAFEAMQVDQFVLEYATPRAGELRVVGEALADREIGLGCVNPRTDQAEAPASIVARAEEALQYWPPERILLNPDCGFGCFANRCVNEEAHAVAADLLADQIADDTGIDDGAFEDGRIPQKSFILIFGAEFHDAFNA